MKTDYRSYALPSQNDKVETIQQNLAEINLRQEPLYLSRAFHLGELISEIAPAERPDRDVILAICERLFPSDSSSSCYSTALRYADLVTLCSEIAAAHPQGYEQVFADLFGLHEPVAPQAQGRVAYVANNYTEQAFMELTGFIKQRRVAYFHHFDDVCQEVRGGLCEYGILPVESTAEGLMAGLFRLIELYELHICALCRIPTAQDGYTSFALVRKTLPLAHPQPQYCLDFLCTPGDPGDISELIGVAGLCSHHLLHAASYRGHDSETLRLRLGISPDSFYPFLLYLALFCQDITPIGFYMIK